eukprot:SAG31_NODE_730_length_12505_cov_3.807109_6_plen_163_part_00
MKCRASLISGLPIPIALIIYLLSGVELDARDNSGQTALHLAAAAGHIKVIDLLIWKGASLEAKDQFGRRPLDLAEAAHNIGAAAQHLQHHEHGWPSVKTQESRVAAAKAEAEEFSHPDYQFLGDNEGVFCAVSGAADTASNSILHCILGHSCPRAIAASRNP